MKGSAVRVRASALPKDLQNTVLPFGRRDSNGFGGNTRGNKTCRYVRTHEGAQALKTRVLPQGVGVSSAARRPAAVPAELVRHIEAEHAAGKSLRQIARDLNASQTPTAHGGAQWWPSTVRSVLIRRRLT